MELGHLQPINLPSLLQQDLEVTFLSADEPRKPMYIQTYMHSRFKFLELAASSASLGSFSLFLIITEVAKASLTDIY